MGCDVTVENKPKKSRKKRITVRSDRQKVSVQGVERVVYDMDLGGHVITISFRLLDSIHGDPISRLTKGPVGRGGYTFQGRDLFIRSRESANSGRGTVRRIYN